MMKLRNFITLLEFDVKENCLDQGQCSVEVTEIVCQDELETHDEIIVSACYESDGSSFLWRSKESSQSLITLIRLIDAEIQKKLNLEKRKDEQKMRYKLKFLKGRRIENLYFAEVNFLISREVLTK